METLFKGTLVVLICWLLLNWMFSFTSGPGPEPKEQSFDDIVNQLNKLNKESKNSTPGTPAEESTPGTPAKQSTPVTPAKQK